MSRTRTVRHPLQTAVDILGSQSALAAACGVERATISVALMRGGEVSTALAVAVEAATKGAVTREVLAPSVYAVPPVRVARDEPTVDTAA